MSKTKDPPKTLHAPKTHKDAWKALIAAKFVGCKLEVPEKFIIGISNMTDKFLECNPTGKPPVLETTKGSIFDSNAIARYIAFGSDLMGSTPDERDLVDQWIGFSSFDLDSNIMAWLLPIIGCATYIEASIRFFSVGASLAVAVDAVRKGAAAEGMTIRDYVWRGHDPTAVAVMTEDGAAVTGLAIAAASLVAVKAS